MDKSRFCKIVILLFASLFSYSQNSSLEQKAVDYLCNNIADIKRETNIEVIVFSRKTHGISSFAFDIANCFGEINYLKDSIPNQTELDSIDKANSMLTFKTKPLKCFCSDTRLNCEKKTKFILYVFESIKYKNANYVELYLKNKRSREVWIICLKFDETNTKIISRCLKYVHYSGYK